MLELSAPCAPAFLQRDVFHLFASTPSTALQMTVMRDLLRPSNSFLSGTALSALSEITFSACRSLGLS